MSDWIRVTKANPCPKCSKMDWCCVSATFGLILCMRIESNKPSKGDAGGWLHVLDGAKREFVKHQPKPEPPSINATQMMRDWQAETKIEWVHDLAAQLGVSFESLSALHCAWASPHNAWAFPMVDGHGDTCGIRLRNSDGRKWAVTGSRQGIFVPQVREQSTAWITEGPTDAAAAVTLGLFSIGRPSCSGGNIQLAQTLRRKHCTRVVILADADTPGVTGAERLADELFLPCVMLVLPAKDTRAFLGAGGTKQLLESLLRPMIWNVPSRKY